VRALAAVLVLAGLVGRVSAEAPPDAGGVLDLRVVRADGTTATLRDVVRDGPAVVAFWASYCPPCRAEVPALNRAAERWRARGLRVLGVALEEDADRVRDAARTWDMRYDVVRIAPGEDARTDRLFPRGLPTSALVAHGRATMHERVLDDADLERLVPSLTKDAEPLE
jgi:thiol-disulfide isomerase/thioredoxin